MKRKKYAWELPPEIEVRLGENTYGKQRVIFEAGHLLIILHDPPVPDSDKRTYQIFLRKPDGSYLCNGKENGEAKLKQLLDAYQRIFQECDDDYDTADSAEDHFHLLERIAPLNRASSNLHTVLQAAREKVRDDSFLIAMRDDAYEISRNYELLLSDAKTALDYRVARHAEKQAEEAQQMTIAQHKLNILAAVTFPLMAIATIFGMNLRHGMEDQPPFVFWATLGAGIVVGVMTVGWVVQKNGASERRATRKEKSHFSEKRLIK